MYFHSAIKKFFTPRAILLLLMLFGVALFTRPASLEAGVNVHAQTAGFGAAFGYAQTIGPMAYTQTGSIGNGSAYGGAFTPFSNANSGVWSAGNASAAAFSIGTPFGSTAGVQLISFWDGFAKGFARAAP